MRRTSRIKKFTEWNKRLEERKAGRGKAWWRRGDFLKRNVAHPQGVLTSVSRFQPKTSEWSLARKQEQRPNGKHACCASEEQCEAQVQKQCGGSRGGRRGLRGRQGPMTDGLLDPPGEDSQSSQQGVELGTWSVFRFTMLTLMAVWQADCVSEMESKERSRSRKDATDAPAMTWLCISGM